MRAQQQQQQQQQHQRTAHINKQPSARDALAALREGRAPHSLTQHLAVNRNATLEQSVSERPGRTGGRDDGTCV